MHMFLDTYSSHFKYQTYFGALCFVWDSRGRRRIRKFCTTSPLGNWLGVKPYAEVGGHQGLSDVVRQCPQASPKIIQAPRAQRNPTM